MTVSTIIWAQFIWKRHPAVHLPPQIHPLFINPAPGYPHGNKGQVMRAAWLRWRSVSPGIVFVDGDVAIDPWDIRAMNAAIRSDPDAVWTGWAWLWPANPLQEAPMASHRAWVGNHAQWGAQNADGTIDYFSFNTTYIPNRLFAYVEESHQWRKLVFPWADTRLSEMAREARIPARVVSECRPKHIHWE